METTIAFNFFANVCCDLQMSFYDYDVHHKNQHNNFASSFYQLHLCAVRAINFELIKWYDSRDYMGK